MIEKSDLENRGPEVLSRSRRKPEEESSAPGAGEVSPPAAPPSPALSRAEVSRMLAAELRRRLERAREAKPRRTPHCGHCWGEGRQAAIEAMQEPTR
jgi:hypothetical protein